MPGSLSEFSCRWSRSPRVLRHWTPTCRPRTSSHSPIPSGWSCHRSSHRHYSSRRASHRMLQEEDARRVDADVSMARSRHDRPRIAESGRPENWGRSRVKITEKHECLPLVSSSSDEFTPEDNSRSSESFSEEEKREMKQIKKMEKKAKKEKKKKKEEKRKEKKMEKKKKKSKKVKKSSSESSEEEVCVERATDPSTFLKPPSPVAAYVPELLECPPSPLAIYTTQVPPGFKKEPMVSPESPPSPLAIYTTQVPPGFKKDPMVSLESPPSPVVVYVPELLESPPSPLAIYDTQLPPSFKKEPKVSPGPPPSPVAERRRIYGTERRPKPMRSRPLPPGLKDKPVFGPEGHPPDFNKPIRSGIALPPERRTGDMNIRCATWFSYSVQGHKGPCTEQSYCKM